MELEVKGRIVATLQLAFPSLDHGGHVSSPSTSDLVQLVSLFLSQLEAGPLATNILHRVGDYSNHVLQETGAGLCPTHVLGETGAGPYYTHVLRETGTELCPTHTETGAGPCHTHVLKSSLKEILLVALTNLQTDQDSQEAAVSCSSALWSLLTRMAAPMTSLSAALCRFSSTLTLFLSVFLKVPGCNNDPLVHMFQEVWQTLLQKELVHIVSKHVDPWSRCLATMGVCLVASEVGAMLAEFTEGERKGVWLQALLDSLDSQFPSLLYQRYQKWECLEVSGAGELVEMDGGGLIFKSVQLLVDALTIVATVARGCGHQQLMTTTFECALRLINQSWQHIQQCCKGVPDYLPISLCYSGISSLLRLHSFLEQLSLHPSERWSCDSLLVTVGEQVMALKERIVQYHVQLSVTCLLQDSDGGHWQSNHPFHAGEHCSYTIQMWAYHIQGFLHDLCTYLPLEHYSLRDGILTRVLGECLSHLASRYSAISPSPKRAALVLPDVVLILSCVNSVLLQQQASPSPQLQAINGSCNHLLFVSALVACSLQQLQNALACLGKRASGNGVVSGGSEDGEKEGKIGERERGGMEGRDGVEGVASTEGGERDGETKSREWLTFVARYQDQCAVQLQPSSPVSVPPHLQCPLHPSQYGSLLQALLCDGATLCVELCCTLSEGVASQVLAILANCPHSEWALTAVCRALVKRESEGQLSDMLLIELSYLKNLLQQHFGKILQSHLLMKAAGCHGHNLDVKAWCAGLLDGLVEQVHTNVPRPLQTLLFYMGGEMTSTAASRGEGIAKVLAIILNGCVLVSDSSHPIYPLIRSTLHCLQYLLNPDASLPSLSERHASPLSPSELYFWLEETAGKQRESLSSLVELPLLAADPSTLDPSTLAREELSECCFEEHDLAAQAIASSEEGLLALDAVHAQSGSIRKGFDPLKEYANVDANIMLSQQKLMAISGTIDFTGMLEQILKPTSPLKLIKTVRWEWQVGVASLLTPDEERLVDVINEQLLFQ